MGRGHMVCQRCGGPKYSLSTCLASDPVSGSVRGTLIQWGNTVWDQVDTQAKDIAQFKNKDALTRVALSHSPLHSFISSRLSHVHPSLPAPAASFPLSP